MSAASGRRPCHGRPHRPCARNGGDHIGRGRDNAVGANGGGLRSCRDNKRRIPGKQNDWSRKSAEDFAAPYGFFQGDAVLERLERRQGEEERGAAVERILKTSALGDRPSKASTGWASIETDHFNVLTMASWSLFSRPLKPTRMAFNCAGSRSRRGPRLAAMGS
jgi:hypothetical protein